MKLELELWSSRPKCLGSSQCPRLRSRGRNTSHSAYTPGPTKPKVLVRLQTFNINGTLPIGWRQYRPMLKAAPPSFFPITQIFTRIEAMSLKSCPLTRSEIAPSLWEISTTLFPSAVISSVVPQRSTKYRDRVSTWIAHNLSTAKEGQYPTHYQPYDL